VAVVQPFRAVRYAHPSPAVVAPPYDVVSPAEREVLLARDPLNVAHLTLAADPHAAKALYREWLEAGVLIREHDEAMWVWEQRFTDHEGRERSRLGVVAALRAEPYEARVVLPHERTHADAVRSRLGLLRTVDAHLEPLFFLYEGRAPVSRPSRDPDLEAEGTRLWRCDGADDVAAFFADRQLLIADGHHRYETALAYAAETGDDDPRVLAALFSIDDPGLEVLATHRVFRDRPEAGLDGDPCDDLEAALEQLAREPTQRAAAVFYDGAAPRLVRGAEGELDVELVDRLGVEGISYTIDAERAVRAVDAGEASCAVLVRPTPADTVFETAREGRVLPQKATHFHPKLPSGLLFLPLRDA
jgi:uncharacterized protein (DUF1015 family)